MTISLTWHFDQFGRMEFFDGEPELSEMTPRRTELRAPCTAQCTVIHTTMTLA